MMSLQRVVRWLLGVVVMTSAGWLCGCSQEGPDVVPVTGKITVDGKPIANLIVIMQPPDGRPSQGTTNADGVYEMRYTQDLMGVKVGSVGVWFDPLCRDMMEGESVELFKAIPKKYFSRFQDVPIDPREKNVFDVAVSK